MLFWRIKDTFYICLQSKSSTLLIYELVMISHGNDNLPSVATTTRIMPIMSTTRSLVDFHRRRGFIIPFDIHIRYDDTLAQRLVRIFWIVWGRYCNHHDGHSTRRMTSLPQSDIVWLVDNTSVTTWHLAHGRKCLFWTPCWHAYWPCYILYCDSRPYRR